MAQMLFTNLEKRKKNLEAPLAPAPQLGIELGSEDSQIKYITSAPRKYDIFTRRVTAQSCHLKMRQASGVKTR